MSELANKKKRENRKLTLGKASKAAKKERLDARANSSVA